MRPYCFLLLFFFTLPTLAAEVTDLFESQVAVESQSRDDRQAALGEAFGKVLVKVSGQQDVVEISGIGRELNRATDYLVQYGYQTQRGQLYLRAQFDERRVESLLREHSATFWSARRPNIMLWIAKENGTSIQLAGRDDDMTLIPALRAQAAERGLPVSFPLLDLDDRMLVAPSDVWGRFGTPVLAATKRYGADGILMLRVQETADDMIEAQWTLIVGNVRRNGQSEAADSEALGVAVIDSVTNRVAAQYAVTFGGGESSEFTIRILNLQDLERVLLVEDLLKRLASVERATLTRYHQGTAEFELHLIGDMSRALQALELDNRMRRVEAPWGTTASPVLEYQWLQ
ncbi:DUF2066 domain-containing protein [Aliidiomarina sp. Khilg15.8]